jgi:hypothetical protein
MSHSYKTEEYINYQVKNKQGMSVKCRWVIHHNNESGPNSPLHIVLAEIAGEKLQLGDPRMVEFHLPFGVFAEFVGMRVQRDKISKIEGTPPRHCLGLSDQGGYVVMD